jgi:hypothetical protein
MKKAFILFLLFIMVFSVSACTSAPSSESPKQISNDDLYDKILGSWIGQAVGVVWGAITEFVYNGITIPDDKCRQSTALI